MNWLRLVRRAIGIPYLVIGALCAPAVSYLITYGIYPQELTVLYFQMACMAAGSMSVLLGLESILFPASDKRGDRSSLIYDAVLSVCLGFLLIITGKKFSDVYLGEKINGSDPSTWDETTIMYYTHAHALAHTAVVIFFAMLFPLGFLLYANITSGPAAAPAPATPAAAAPAAPAPAAAAQKTNTPPKK